MNVKIYNETGVKLFYGLGSAFIHHGSKKIFGEMFFKKRILERIYLHREDGKGAIIIENTKHGKKYKTFGEIFYRLGPEKYPENSSSLNDVAIHLYSTEDESKVPPCKEYKGSAAEIKLFIFTTK